MAKLSKGARAALPDSAFAGPHRSFPVNDPDHARAALLDVNKAKGLTSSERSEIKEQARKELHRAHPISLPKKK